MHIDDARKPAEDDGDGEPEVAATASDGWTKQALLDASGLSSKTFDTIRRAARIKGPMHGGLNWVFSAEDVLALIHRAASGRFSDRGGIPAAAWRALLTARGVELPPVVRKPRSGGMRRGGHGRSR